MPKRKAPPLTPVQRSERVAAEVQRLEDAGEFNHTAAADALDAIVRQAAKPKENDDGRR